MNCRRLLILGVFLLGLGLAVSVLAPAAYSLSGARTVAGPAVAILSPHQGEQVNVGEVVKVRSSSRDEVNKVVRVELWVDRELIETDTHEKGASLLSLTQGWQPQWPGSHTLIVRAFNGAGAAGQATIAVEAVVAVGAVADRDTLPLPGELPTVEELIASGEVPRGSDVPPPPGGLPTDEATLPLEAPPVEPAGYVPEEGPVPPQPDAEPPPRDLVDQLFDGGLGLVGLGRGIFAPPLDTSPVLVIFEALELEVGGGYDDVYCYFALADSPVERVPESGFFRRLGEGSWDIAEHLSGENNRAVGMLPSDPLRVFGECHAWMGDAWQYLGLVDVLHPSEDWDGHSIRVSGTGGGGFELAYRLIVSTPVIQAPHDLQHVQVAGRHYLRWSWEGNEEDIEGFRVYRNDNLVTSLPPDARSTPVSSWWIAVPCGNGNEVFVTAYEGEFEEGEESAPSNLLAIEGPACGEADDITKVEELPSHACSNMHEVDIEYRYASDRGEQVWLGAWPVGPDGRPFGGSSNDLITHGEGVARMYLEYPGEGTLHSSQLWVAMWASDGNTFYSTVVDIPMTWDSGQPDLLVAEADVSCDTLSRRVEIQNAGCGRAETDALTLEFVSGDGAYREAAGPTSISLGPGQSQEFLDAAGGPTERLEDARERCRARWGDGFEVLLDRDNSVAEGDEENNSYAVIGDLSISSVEAVQVVYGAPLVKDKGTAFRVRVNSTFPLPAEVKFRLYLPDTQWSTLLPVTGLHVPAMPFLYPEAWGPITIPARATDYEVMLPIIPDAQRDDDFDPLTNPAGLLRGRSVAGFIGPDVRVVPRPIADSAAFAVEIDPLDEIEEVSEENNRMVSSDYDVVGTQYWSFLFVPTKYLATGCAPLLSAIEAGTKGHMEYSLATFPIADSRIIYSHNWNSLEVSPDGQRRVHATTWDERDGNWGYEARWQFLDRIARLAKDANYDYGVGLVCEGGGAILGNAYAVYAGANNIPEVFAHEFNHTVVPMADIYSLDCYCGWVESYCELANGTRLYCCWGRYSQEKQDRQNAGINPGQGCVVNCGLDETQCDSGCCWNRCKNACDLLGGTTFGCPDRRTEVNMPAAEGFWVNKWTPIQGRTYFMDGPSGNNWMILGSAQDIGALQGRDPACGLHGADLDGYLNLLLHQDSRFRSATDPEALLVSGSVHKNGTAVLDPFIRLGETNLDIEPGAAGDYYFVLLGEGSSVLSKSGFTPRFYRSDPAGGPTEETGFVYRIEWKEGTRRIELQDSQGNVLASREVSPRKPEVRVTYPNGGEVWEEEQSYTVEWEASDADGDSLVYSIALSMDGGERWLPIDVDVEGNEYVLSAAALVEGEDYLIRVRATDGVNTAEDVSDGAFVVGVQRLPNSWVAVGLLLLVTIGLASGAVVIAILTRKVRRA